MDSPAFRFLTVNVAQKRGLGTVLDFSVNRLPPFVAGQMDDNMTKDK